MTSPVTPKKRKPRDLNRESLHESPYFSPPKTYKAIDVEIYSERIPPSLDHLSNPSSRNETIQKFIASTEMPHNQGQSQEDPFIIKISEISGLIARLGKLKPSLIQESVAGDPWKLLIAVTLLNKTAGKLAIPTFWNVMTKWPTPLDLSQANEQELTSFIRHLGTQTIRAKRLITLSRLYLQEPPSMYDLRSSTVASPSRRGSPFFSAVNLKYPATPISHLPGTGRYALDSYRIFCTVHDDPTSEEWKLVLPTDKELIRYLRWKWAFVESMEWCPSKGPICTVTYRFLTALIIDLENNISRSIS